MKWKVWFLLFPTATVSFPSGLLGKWRPDNLPNIMIHVMDQCVVGTMNEKHTVQMDIRYQKTHEIILDNIQLQKKPSDWFNVVKYKDYIRIYKKIKEYGITCNFSFRDEKNLEIWSKIGEEKYQFLLQKILEE